MGSYAHTQGRRTGIPGHAVGAAGTLSGNPFLGDWGLRTPTCSQEAGLDHCLLFSSKCTSLSEKRPHATASGRRCQAYKLPLKSPSLLGNDASLFLCFHERTNRHSPGRVWSEVMLGPRPHFCPEEKPNPPSLCRMVSWVHRG